MNFVLRKTPGSAPFVVHMDKIKRCYSPPAKDWTLGPEGEADQPDAAVAPAARSRVQPSQDQTSEDEVEVTPPSTGTAVTSTEGTMPAKKARKEARHRGVTWESQSNEEPEVVDSPS